MFLLAIAGWPGAFRGDLKVQYSSASAMPGAQTASSRMREPPPRLSVGGGPAPARDSRPLHPAISSVSIPPET